MFESSILNKLSSDVALNSHVSIYKGQPAIFSEAAPEDAEFPYIIFRIIQSNTDSPAILKFSIFIDYYDYNKSHAGSRAAAERIEFLLDRAELEHERFSKIRCFFYEGSSLEEEDPRAIHYNLYFIARAGNKNFGSQQDPVSIDWYFLKKYNWFMYN